MSKLVHNKVVVDQYTAIVLRVGWALLLLWLTRFGFFLFNHTAFQSLQPSDWGPILWGGLRFDIAAVCYINSLYVLLQAAPLRIRYQQQFQRFTRGIFICTNGLALLVNCADMVYFPFT
ncbi:MAG: LTA synthase family protein, partial [Bacteroidota bacterium]